MLRNVLKMCFRDMQAVKYVSSFHITAYPKQDASFPSFLSADHSAEFIE
jgi:hypothetical protein